MHIFTYLENTKVEIILPQKYKALISTNKL